MPASRVCRPRKKGTIEALRAAPPAGSVVVDLDEPGPISARSYPGMRLVPATAPGPHGPRAGRATQEIDYGRRGKGYIFGALQAVTGEVLTHPYPRRTAANFADFLEQVEAWLPADAERVYAIVDNLEAHRATDVLLFSLAHPRWEFGFQPNDAAYLDLIEPWWKILRSLALTDRRFETWEEVCQAVAEATSSWNARRHPFVWGRRRRHRRHATRQPGIAALPKVA